MLRNVVVSSGLVSYINFSVYGTLLERIVVADRVGIFILRVHSVLFVTLTRITQVCL